MSEKRHYSLLIIGGGAAGCCAGMYGVLGGADCAVIEAFSPGGQLLSAGQIRNYPGIEPVSGAELARRFHSSAKEAGVEFLFTSVRSAALTGSVKRLDTDQGLYTADAVILAAGAVPRPLGLPGEQRLIGCGVSYCAQCDGFLFKGKDVAVVGGGNTAVSQALYLSALCRSVTLIHRRGEFRASAALLSQLEATENVRILHNTQISALNGQEILESITLSNQEILPCQGLFVAIGRPPATSFLSGQLETDDNGHLLTDERCRTALPGVFAAGDIRTSPLKQIVTAAADGAIAAVSALEYLKAPGNA